MSLKTISLELARSPGQPEGDPEHGYVFRAPLDENGYLDLARWPSEKQLCIVRRVSGGKTVEIGQLIHSGGKWAFSYARGRADDENLFRLSTHKFTPGEYVSITEHDGVQRTFKVVSVDDWLHKAA